MTMMTNCFNLFSAPSHFPINPNTGKTPHGNDERWS